MLASSAMFSHCWRSVSCADALIVALPQGGASSILAFPHDLVGAALSQPAPGLQAPAKAEPVSNAVPSSQPSLLCLPATSYHPLGKAPLPSDHSIANKLD